jgi:hypothetical protein
VASRHETLLCKVKKLWLPELAQGRVNVAVSSVATFSPGDGARTALVLPSLFLCVGLITSVLAASGKNNMWLVTVPNLEQKGCGLADERARLKVESFRAPLSILFF